jgi:hypothetical protein
MEVFGVLSLSEDCVMDVSSLAGFRALMGDDITCDDPGERGCDGMCERERFALCANAHLRRKIRAEDGAPGL